MIIAAASLGMTSCFFLSAYGLINWSTCLAETGGSLEDELNEDTDFMWISFNPSNCLSCTVFVLDWPPKLFGYMTNWKFTPGCVNFQRITSLLTSDKQSELSTSEVEMLINSNLPVSPSYLALDPVGLSEIPSLCRPQCASGTGRRHDGWGKEFAFLKRLIDTQRSSTFPVYRSHIPPAARLPACVCVLIVMESCLAALCVDSSLLPVDGGRGLGEGSL